MSDNPLQKKFNSRYNVFVIHKDDDGDKLNLIYNVFDSVKMTVEGMLQALYKEGVPENSQLSYKQIQNINNELDNGFNDIKIFLSLLEKIFCFTKVITIATENIYIDREFRDTYYLHYSEKHMETLRYCTRLLLFNGNKEKIMEHIKFSNQDYGMLQKDLIGSIVIRPLSDCSIGRTLISPRFLFYDNEIYIRKTTYKIHFKNKCFKVNAFPFRMQDRITITCAETTLINILDYYSNEYVDYKYTVPSDIHNTIKGYLYDRHIPATGLSCETISSFLYKAGFAPKLYLTQKNTMKTIKILSYYIESGIPVGIGTTPTGSNNYLGHAVVCIGHGKCNFKLKYIRPKSTDNTKIFYINIADTHDYFIMQDDTQRPYSMYRRIGTDKLAYISDKEYTKDKIVKILKEKINEILGHNIESDILIKINNIIQQEVEGDLTEKINTELEKSQKTDSKLKDDINREIGNQIQDIRWIVVPLHRRMYMDAQKAQDTILSILDNEEYLPYKKSDDTSLCGFAEDNPIVIRIFLASSRHFKEYRLDTINNEVLCAIYQEIPLPNFVWVCELYSKNGYKDKKAFGEIVLDATYSGSTLINSCLLINYPNRFVARDLNGKNLLSDGDFDWVLDSPSELFPAYNRNLHKIPNVDDLKD